MGEDRHQSEADQDADPPEHLVEVVRFDHPDLGEVLLQGT
jgi:hypothetical protein